MQRVLQSAAPSWAATATARAATRRGPWHRRLATPASPRPRDLPPSQTLAVDGGYEMEFVDVRATTESVGAPAPTLVFLHGSPGTYHDFKYLLPLLQENARVIGINLPEMGSSKVLPIQDPKLSYYDRISATSVHGAAYSVMKALCDPREPVFVIGHSFGGHAAIHVAARNEDSGRSVNIRGLALLAPAGLRRHRALRTVNLELLWRLLRSDFSLVEAAARAYARHLYTRTWRFPANNSTEYFVAGIARCASTDSGAIGDDVRLIRDLPCLLAWARDDAFIEEPIFSELDAALGSGPRLVFDRGGHNIQKTKATLIAEELQRWTSVVVLNEA